jgi:glycosyltransferase involved in cell wall biosynthesis
MATQVDHIIAADNGSTDGTREILEQLATELPLTVVHDPDPAYWQAAKMTALARRAGEHHGADWIVPHDYDEYWYSPFGRIADVLTERCDRFAVARANLYDHVATSADDPNDPSPFTRMGWRRREKTPLPKVACRWREDLTIEMGNHAANYHRYRPRTVKGQLVVRHFPYRTPEQFVRKAKTGATALALTDLPDSAGQHWRDYARLAAANGDESLAGVFAEWFHADDPSGDPSLIFDPAP